MANTRFTSSLSASLDAFHWLCRSIGADAAVPFCPGETAGEFPEGAGVAVGAWLGRGLHPAAVAKIKTRPILRIANDRDRNGKFMSVLQPVLGVTTSDFFFHGPAINPAATDFATRLASHRTDVSCATRGRLPVGKCQSLAGWQIDDPATFCAV